MTEAAEQTIDLETDPDESSAAEPSSGVDVREAAKAAAEKALADEGEGAEKTDEPEPPKDKAKAKAAPEAPADPAKTTKLAIELRARKLAQQTRESREAEISRREQEAIARYREAEELRRQYEPIARATSMLGNDPAAALRELSRQTGKPLRELTDAMLVEGTPDPTRDLSRQVQEQEARYAALEQKFQAYIQEQEQSRIVSQQRANAQNFVSICGDESRFPTLNRVYADDPAGLVELAEKVRREYWQATRRTASHEDLAEYLEHLEQERASRYISAEQGRQVAASNGKSSPGVRANGQSPLSTATTTQRASAPIPHERMTDEERREAAKAAAERAMREYRGGGA